MTSNNINRNTLISMLQYMRPAYSMAEEMFCKEYLEPVFGEPDVDNNYICVVGDKPKIAFTAHTDTVHKSGGIQTLKIEDNFVTSVGSNCLGADCTTGLWLMLGMIEAGVEGVYVAHAAEEIGGIGSTALVARNPDWLSHIQACISFDRYGTNSVITNQGGFRTCSDEFACSVADTLHMPQLLPDSGGTYTDSVEYADVVRECSNLSVGYYDQHTSRESQDLLFAETLLERLIAASWSTLEIVRDPTLPRDYSSRGWKNNYYGYIDRKGYDDDDDREEDLNAIRRILLDRPIQVAELLLDYGLNAESLCEELQVSFADQMYYTDAMSSKSYY